METFLFIKIITLPAYEKASIKSSTIDEAITRLGISIGVSFKFDAITINTTNVSREWIKRRTESVDTTYEIEPDSSSRQVFAVYQLGYPSINKNDTYYSTRTQCKEIIRHVAHKKTFMKQHMTITKFSFYACLLQQPCDPSPLWPKQFLVTEPHVGLMNLESDLLQWQCIMKSAHATVRTRNKTAYISMDQSTMTEIHHYHHSIYMNAYLNGPKKEFCKQCRHNWTFRQLKDMIECSIKVPRSNSSLEKRIKLLESTHSSCGLWQLYFPSDLPLATNAAAKYTSPTIIQQQSSLPLSSFQWWWIVTTTTVAILLACLILLI